MNPTPTIKNVVEALDPLKGITRPEGDNEGDPINSPDVYNRLSSSDKALVDHAEELVGEYLRKTGDDGDEPNGRSITTLNKKGFPTSLNTDQQDPYRLVGNIEIGDWILDVSDKNNESYDE